MTANNSPVFPSAPKSFSITLAPGAITNYTSNTPSGVTTLGTIGESGAQGSSCKVTPLATNTAAMLCFYKRKAGEGPTIWHLFAAKYIAAATVSTSVPPLPISIPDVAGMDFEAGDVVGVGTWATLTANVEVDFNFYDLTKSA